MFYELAHFIRNHCSCIWEIIERGNAWLFALSHYKQLENIPQVLNEYCNQYKYKLATEDDVPALVSFFSRQPNEAFVYFKPHGFDEKSLTRVCCNKAFLIFLVYDSGEIVGYFFMHCFFTGKAFRGKFVDARYYGQGIAVEMGHIMTDVARRLRLRVFGSISPDNYASLASAKKSNDLKIIKTLDNGYYYIEFVEKHI